MKKNHKLKIDRITQQTDRYLKMSKERIQGLKEEHTAELESRDQMQAILLVDLRELCQVYDEEIAVLKATIDRQGKCTSSPTLILLC
jgi:hypothetical protein